MCTSLKSIITSGTEIRQKQDIEQLFKYKQYPRFQLRQFYAHPLFQQSQQFHFFIDILEEWNRKTDQQQLSNSSNTLYFKNVYIYNNLRTTILQLPQHSHLVLQKLSLWYNKTRNNKIRVIEKKQQQSTVDEAWQIRNTFKSNLPAEIDLYRRRIFWDLSDKQNQKLTKSNFNELNSRKIKSQVQNAQNIKREIQNKRLIKIQNEAVRFQRQRNELTQMESRWKVKKAKEEEFMVKKFYNGNFSSCKTYFPKKQKIDPELTHPILKRAQTSLGYRNSKSLNRNRFSQTTLVPSKLTARKLQAVADKFDEFEMNQVCLSDIVGLNLLINPNQKKMKKRKRRK